MMSREAAIGIDGAYYNPAGVAFLSPGHHFSFNWQTAIQSRTIENDYPLFGNNTADNSTHRKFRGKAFAPVLPSVQYAYNWHDFSFQFNGGLIGGGGKCTFDDGLGSFEKIVGETALGAVGLAGAVDQALGQQMFTSPQMFGSDGKYSFNSYMRGRVSLPVCVPSTPRAAIMAMYAIFRWATCRSIRFLTRRRPIPATSS